jgi:hypothetical protein
LPRSASGDGELFGNSNVCIVGGWGLTQECWLIGPVSGYGAIRDIETGPVVWWRNRDLFDLGASR